MIRYPKRDMSRPQSPVPGWEGGWRERFRRTARTPLTTPEIASLINGALKETYAKHVRSLFPDSKPLSWGAR